MAIGGVLLRGAPSGGGDGVSGRFVSFPEFEYLQRILGETTTMTKPFSTLAGLLLLAGAAVHGYRLYHPFDVIISGHSIPLWYSWPIAGVAAVLGILVLAETRR